MSMKDGVCPECGPSDIRTPSPAEAGWRFFNIGRQDKSPVETDSDIAAYICTACGRVEFTADKSLREYAREHWLRVAQ